ncbi:MAG: hypothetical protein Q7T37_01540 [bacterium]|nr:hypothetical protein [bacterium]MDO8742314.1 hypothetical protein [bacterium]
MKSSLTHLILVLVMCAGSVGGFWFWYTSIAEESVEATILQGQINAKSGAISRITTARSVFAEIANDETAVQSYFVPETGIVAFIDTLESRGRSLGATVDVLSVSTGGDPAHPTLELTLSIKGSFDSVMRTVGSIEYAPYAISVSSLLVGRDVKEAWMANLKMRVASVPSEGSKKSP